MSTDPLNDQFDFVQEESPRLRGRPNSRRSSMVRRFCIGFAFITLDLAILACILHLLRVVAIPGLPAKDDSTPGSARTSSAAERADRSGKSGPSEVAKLVRYHEILTRSGWKKAGPAEESAADSNDAQVLQPDDVLESEGLKKVRDGYVFSDEEDLQKRLENARATYKQVKAAFEHLKKAAYDFQALSGAIQSRDAERTELDAAIAGQQEFVNRLPRVTNLERAAYDEANGSLSMMRARLIEVKRQLDHGNRELRRVTQQRDEALRVYKTKQSDFLGDGQRLERALDSRIKGYHSLAIDPKIKNSLEAIRRASGKSLKFSPSKELLTGRDELKKALKTVESAEVPQP
jgi:hypothetical protein